ncbi:MAG: 30S ribosomal protein S3 [Ktedonobacterales bacterium]
MGHKVNPNGFRLGVIKGWESRWYANRNYKDLVYEDYKLRNLINKRLANAGVARIEIERVAGTQISIAIHTAKPGIVIGKNGESVERLRQALENETKKKVRLSILEIRNPEVDATLIARSIAEQIEKRVSFRRAMKQAVQKAMRQGAKGIKVVSGGRLGGAEIARTEKEVEGSVPLQTLRANIDYGQTEAHTTYGVIGIKVWVYHGDVLPERQRAEGLHATDAAVPAGERGGDRGPRGGGERGPRPGGERGPRPAGAGGPRGGGERGPRPSGPRSGGPGGERGARPGGERGPRPAGARPSGPAGERGPRPQPTGEITPEVGANLPPSGPVNVAPASHEFPAPAASEGATTPAQTAEAETKPTPSTSAEESQS